MKIDTLATLCWVSKDENINAQKIFLAHRTIFFPVTENKFIVWHYCFSDPASFNLFEFSNVNSNIKGGICSKLIIEAPDIFLVFLLLTLTTFDTLCFYGDLEPLKVDIILYCLNLNLSMDFRVGSKSPVTFKAKVCETTINNSFQFLLYLLQRAPS